MMTGQIDLLAAVAAWLQQEPAVEAAVLFGSSARVPSAAAAAGSRSDLDLHVVTSDAAHLEQIDWRSAIPEGGFCLQAVRPATGGVRKVTALFVSGEIDLVLVPAKRLRLGRLAVRCGLHRRRGGLRVALNEIATCMHSGYRFLKGEKEWGAFYARIVAEMPGVRLSDPEAVNLADIFICDLCWVFQKLERGELSAAQHLTHRSLAETNFRLMRELRLRRGQPVLSFGLGRKVESTLSPKELTWVQVDARLQREDLGRAAWTAFKGMRALMRELIPAWQVPSGIDELLVRHSTRAEQTG
jgi:hypothetical protein